MGFFNEIPPDRPWKISQFSHVLRHKHDTKNDTVDGWNLHHLVCKDPTNNGRSYLSTGAGFQPSTVSSCFFFLVAWKSSWNHLKSPSRNRNRRKNRGMERWHGQYWCDVSSIIQHRGCSCITIALRWNSNAKTTMENPKKQPILKSVPSPLNKHVNGKSPRTWQPAVDWDMDMNFKNMTRTVGKHGTVTYSLKDATTWRLIPSSKWLVKGVTSHL